MSAYTTLFITRSKAKEVYLKSLPVAVTDEILKEFMDKLLIKDYTTKSSFS